MPILRFQSRLYDTRHLESLAKPDYTGPARDRYRKAFFQNGGCSTRHRPNTGRSLPPIGHKSRLWPSWLGCTLTCARLWHPPCPDGSAIESPAGKYEEILALHQTRPSGCRNSFQSSRKFERVGLIPVQTWTLDVLPLRSKH